MVSFMNTPGSLMSQNEYGNLFNYGNSINSSNLFGLGNSGVAAVAPVDFSNVASTSNDSGGVLSSINNWMKSSGLIGSTDANGLRTDGWGGLALGTAQGLGNMYLGMQQYGLAKQALQQNKETAKRNYDQQLATIRGTVSDTAGARYAANPGAYGNVGKDAYTASQLAKYGVA